MAVTFINLFEVPAGSDADFRERWEAVNDYVRRKDGYLNHVLHRALTPDARYRYVNVVEWQSAQHWRDAHDAGFRALVSTAEWARYPSTPTLFDVVHSGSPEDGITVHDTSSSPS